MNNEALSSSVSFLTNTVDNNQLIVTKKKSNSNTASCSLFKLSTPLKCFHITTNLIDKPTSYAKTSNDLFNFNQPYQAKTFQSDKINNKNRSLFLVDQSPYSVMKSIKLQEQVHKENNLVNINSRRNHPYIRPSNGHHDKNTTISVESIASKDSNETNEINSSNETISSPIRYSSSNAILAHLKSISPNFKSIFVRPKTHKPIDASTLLHKTKVHSKNISLQPSYMKNTSLYNNILPRIELKELRLNSSVDDILKKFANEDDVIRRTIKNMTTSQAINPLTMIMTTNIDKSFGTGLISTETNETNKSLSQSQLQTKAAQDSLTSKLKWTCMVCLSKHSFKLDVCSICGSSKTSSLNLQNVQQLTSPASSSSSSSSSTLASCLLSLKKKQQQTTPISSSTPSTSPSTKLFSSYLINELGLKQKFNSINQQAKLSSTDEEVTKKNPYIKKWTCLQCSYPNDSLKIVCINCRWVKTSPFKSTPIVDITLEPPPYKRNKSHDNILIVEINDKQQTKDQNNNVYCASCKSPIKKDQTTIISKDIIEIPPIESKNKETSLSTSFFAKPLENKQTPMWKCDTCLVSNAETSEKCVCCMTLKPTGTEQTNVVSQVPLKPLASSKWTCDICLVQNEVDKSNCACCQTPKPGSAPKPSLTTAPTLKLSESNILSSPITSTIKFGSNATTPIQFGTAPSTTQSNIKFNSVFKLPEDKTISKNEENLLFPSKQLDVSDKTFKFGLSTAKSTETSKSETETVPKISFTTTSGLFKESGELDNKLAAAKLPVNLTLTPFSSLSTTGSLSQAQPTFNVFTNNQNANKPEPSQSLPTFGTSIQSSQATTSQLTNSFFTPPKSISPQTTLSSATNLSGNLNFFNNNNNPIESTSSISFSTPSTTTLFSPQNPPQFSSPFSSNAQSANLFSKPSFSSTFPETQPSLPAFGNIGSSSLMGTTPSQSFPQFDFKPTTTSSFPNLANQQSKSFQFTPFGSNMTEQNKPASFIPSLNPIINFVENPNTIIFSGNTEQGNNTPSEISARRYRKASRKHR